MMKKRTFPYHRSALFTKKSALLPKSKAHSSLNYTVGSVPLCNSKRKEITIIFVILLFKSTLGTSEMM